MSNRQEVLDMISAVMTRIKNSSYEQRFTLIDNVQLLSGILNEVTEFENGLLTDLDVD